MASEEQDQKDRLSRNEKGGWLGFARNAFNVVGGFLQAESPEKQQLATQPPNQPLTITPLYLGIGAVGLLVIVGLVLALRR